MRLDRRILELYPDFSRSRIEGLIKAGFVSVNGEPAGKAGQSVDEADEIDVEIPPPVPAEPEPELATGEPEFPQQAESEQESALEMPGDVGQEFGLPVRDYPPGSSDSGDWWHYSRSTPDRPRRWQKGWICALFSSPENISGAFFTCYL